MKTILNLLWILLVGWWSALGWLITGLVLLLTVVFAPFGRQCFKMAHFTLWPFGREAVSSSRAVSGSALGNLLWFLPGIFFALGYVLGGLVLCLTVVGIPFGTQSFKFAGLALAPFGKEIVRTKDLRSGAWVQSQSVIQQAPPPVPPRSP